MVVSDYDGTLLNGKQSLVDNIEAISNFRKNSNLFVIATERGFPSIKKEIDFYNIPYDYLICNNGSVIFDNSNNLLKVMTISPDFVKEILEYLDFIGINKPILYCSDGKTHSIKNVVEISVVVNSCDQMKIIKNYLNEKYQDIHMDKTYNQISIRCSCFKDTGVDYICSLLNDKVKEIYSIGNDKNDLEMLKRFKGYLMYNAYLRDAGLKKCTSVKQLIKKVM